jgi:hypothetical protein
VSDSWFTYNHPLHSPGASRALKIRSEQRLAAASSKLRFTPKRGLPSASPAHVPVVVPSTSPKRQIAKKLTFPSPAANSSKFNLNVSSHQNSNADNMINNCEQIGGSRKRRPESVRMVGSGPFSEARQKKTVKSMLLEETESGSQNDLISEAAAVTAPEVAPAFDAAARRLLFQLSPTGHTLVSATVPKHTPEKNDIFAELEKLTISSNSKEAPTKKRTLASTPPRSVRLAGPPARVAPGSLLADENLDDLNDEVRLFLLTFCQLV